MIAALAGLMVFQLIGEVIVQLSGVPVPGPVVGMVLLFVSLLFRGAIPVALRTTSQALLAHLSLLFVPAGVGIMLHVERVSNEWFAIVVALTVSTLLALTVTALVMRGLMWLMVRTGQGEAGE
jgi:holin-like protein